MQYFNTTDNKRYTIGSNLRYNGRTYFNVNEQTLTELGFILVTKENYDPSKPSTFYMINITPNNDKDVYSYTPKDLDTLKEQFITRFRNEFTEWCRTNTDDYFIEAFRKGISYDDETLTDVRNLVTEKEDDYKDLRNQIQNCTTIESLENLINGL